MSYLLLFENAPLGRSFAVQHTMLLPHHVFKHPVNSGISNRQFVLQHLSESNNILLIHKPNKHFESYCGFCKL